MITTPISFDKLKDIPNGNTAVMIAVVFEENEDWDVVQNFLSEELCFSKGKNLIGCHRITGNILRDKGRWDYLLVFDHPEIPFNPIARLRFPDIKWTSDFIDIFSKDYQEE